MRVDVRATVLHHHVKSTHDMAFATGRCVAEQRGAKAREQARHGGYLTWDTRDAPAASTRARAMVIAAVVSRDEPPVSTSESVPSERS